MLRDGDMHMASAVRAGVCDAVRVSELMPVTAAVTVALSMALSVASTMAETASVTVVMPAPSHQPVSMLLAAVITARRVNMTMMVVRRRTARPIAGTDRKAQFEPTHRRHARVGEDKQNGDELGERALHGVPLYRRAGLYHLMHDGFERGV